MSGTSRAGDVPENENCFLNSAQARLTHKAIRQRLRWQNFYIPARTRVLIELAKIYKQRLQRFTVIRCHNKKDEKNTANYVYRLRAITNCLHKEIIKH